MLVHFVDLPVVGRDLVLYVLTSLEPAAAGVLPSLLAPKRGSHTVVEQAVAFSEVNYADSDTFLGVVGWIKHAEVEPLQVVAAIRVVAHPQVEGAGVTLSDLVYVAALEVAVELYGLCLVAFADTVLVTAHFNGASIPNQSWNGAQVVG